MKVISWNVRRAGSGSAAWSLLKECAPDLMLLQEVAALPSWIREEYNQISRSPRTRSGGFQKFSTVIASRYPFIEAPKLIAEDDWLTEQIEYFSGNIAPAAVRTSAGHSLNLVNVYSPAWPLHRSAWKERELEGIKLAANPDFWCTEVLWAALRQIDTISTERWIVAGDFNSSPLFDDGPRGDRGNREVVRRMNSIGLVDGLSDRAGCLVPTFRDVRARKLIHQLDYIYLSAQMIGNLRQCDVHCAQEVLGSGLSDHLPVVAEFDPSI